MESEIHLKLQDTVFVVRGYIIPGIGNWNAAKTARLPVYKLKWHDNTFADPYGYCYTPRAELTVIQFMETMAQVFQLLHTGTTPTDIEYVLEVAFRVAERKALACE